MKAETKDTFSLLHTNIFSLQYNAGNLKQLLASLEFKLDIFALAETWNPDYMKHTFRQPLREVAHPPNALDLTERWPWFLLQ